MYTRSLYHSLSHSLTMCVLPEYILKSYNHGLYFSSTVHALKSSQNLIKIQLRNFNQTWMADGAIGW